MSVSIHPTVDQAEAAGARTESARHVGAFDRYLATHIQRLVDAAGVRIELWDGSSAYAGATPPVGDIVVKDRRTLLGLVINPELWFGEMYMQGRLDIRGALLDVVEAVTRAASPVPSVRERLAGWLAARNTVGDSRQNVHHHYDLGNSFYKLWLDRELVYTCAYYPTPDASLDEAQVAKLDLVCRKLRLRPGETVVETGCGWGALALHMARRYGVRVKAFNVSEEQLRYARGRAASEGLSGLVEFIDDDYRNVSGRFDAFVSIGMLEHVGRRNFGDVAEVVRRCLRRDGGRGILHFIGRDAPRPVNAWITRRIFPGSYTPTLAEVNAQILAPAGMSILDVENLRLHYARTLAHWSERYSAARDQVRATYGEEFARAWALYLAGSKAAFTVGFMQLFQIVFSPRESTPPSWTRSDPFGPPGAAA